MIRPINHIADWRYTRQRKQTQTNKDAARENTTRINHDYRVGDKVMKNIKSEYKYKTPFKVTYKSVQTWMNGTVILQTGEVTNRVNIHNIKSYNDSDVE